MLEYLDAIIVRTTRRTIVNDRRLLMLTTTSVSIDINSTVIKVVSRGQEDAFTNAFPMANFLNIRIFCICNRFIYM